MDRNVITIEILPEDFKSAPHGYSNGTGELEGCVLWQAVKRLYPDSHPFVSANTCRFDGISYGISFEEWGHQNSSFSIAKINELSRQAKQSLEGIPTVSITLTPY